MIKTSEFVHRKMLFKIGSRTSLEWNRLFDSENANNQISKITLPQGISIFKRWISRKRKRRREMIYLLLPRRSRMKSTNHKLLMVNRRKVFPIFRSQRSSINPNPKGFAPETPVLDYGPSFIGVKGTAWAKILKPNNHIVHGLGPENITQEARGGWVPATTCLAVI